MVTFLISKQTRRKENQCVSKSQEVQGERRNSALEHDQPEVLDVNEHGICVENRLYRRGKAVYRIENSGNIGEHHGENAPKVLYIAEEDEHCRKDKPDADVKQRKADYREYKHQEERSNCNAVRRAKNDENNERQ